MKQVFSIILFLIFSSSILAQEGIKPLSCNLNYFYGDLSPAQKEAPQDAPKERPGSLSLPFLDDFYYAGRKIYPDQNLWADSLVYVNSGFARAPVSIGVATFDGLNQHGFPYVNSLSPNLNASDPADTLTSRPINLLVVGGATMTPADSIGLSFHYQARGFGEVPELNDSLILDLYRPKDNTWKSRVWFTRGISAANYEDTVFKKVFIRIDSTAYLQDGFKFRFRNKATYGNFDHWHLDYVYLNRNRTAIPDSFYNDVTFAQVPTSFLRDYSAMPYVQYTKGEMASNNSVLLKNNSNSNINIYYGIKFFDHLGIQQYTYSAQSDNIEPFKSKGYMKATAFANPAGHSTFTYKYPDPLPRNTDYKIIHYVFRNGTSNDFIVPNDTAYQYQRFQDYYAFDDGSPEAGYYVNGVAGKMAVKIHVNVTDTLRALRVYFDPSPIGSAEKFYFKIKVWTGVAQPQTLVALRDSTYKPRFIKTGFKEIPEYTLTTPLILTPGTYFIGIQQQLSTGLVVGFDRNYDARKNLYYDPGTGWEQSAIKGALMMRPVFGSKLLPMTISDGQTALSNHYFIYPNPSSDRLMISTDQPTTASYQFYNSLGQKVLEGKMDSSQQEVTTESLTDGIYLLVLKENGKPTHQQKIIIQK